MPNNYDMGCGHGEEFQVLIQGRLQCIYCGPLAEHGNALPAVVATPNEDADAVNAVLDALGAATKKAEVEGRSSDAATFRIAAQTIKNLARHLPGAPPAASRRGLKLVV